jgi:TATA-binding protein-associated factor
MQALQYLLKLCSHPLLVTGESPPDYLVDHLKEIGVGAGGELHELHHSPKLVALQEILHECGIGSEISSPDASAAIGQHRVLIFAQHKVLGPSCCDVPLYLSLTLSLYSLYSLLFF